MSKKVVSRLLEKEVAKRGMERMNRLRGQGLSEMFTPEEQEQLARLAEEDPQRAVSFAAQETLIKKTRSGRQDVQAVLQEQMLLSENRAHFKLVCSPASYVKSRFDEALAGEQWMALEAVLWTLQEAELPPPGAEREWLVGAMPDGAFVVSHDADDEGAAWRALTMKKTRELAFEKIFDDLAGGPISKFLPPAVRNQESLQSLAERIIAVNFEAEAPAAFSCIAIETLQAGLRGADSILWRNPQGAWEPMDAEKACDLLQTLSRQAQGLAPGDSIKWLRDALSPERRLSEGLARWGLEAPSAETAENADPATGAHKPRGLSR